MNSLIFITIIIFLVLNFIISSITLIVILVGFKKMQNEINEVKAKTISLYSGIETGIIVASKLSKIWDSHKSK